MSRSTFFAFALLCSLGAPLCALAEAPGSVTGLQAQAQADGSILVQWTPLEDAISVYRVYFSQKSILENNGYYDDVETTDGSTSNHTLRSVPQNFPTVYMSVMAVNAQGEESPFFTEEVRVDRMPASSSVNTQSVSSTIPQSSSTAASLHLLSTQALSATRVGLMFSATPVIDPAQAPSAFSIIDAQGQPLPIEQLTIEGGNATVQTVRQTAGVVYQIRLTEPLAGEGGLTLDQIDRTAFFTGHSTGLSPAEAAARTVPTQQQTTPTQQQQAPALPGMAQQQPGSLPDIVNFRLEASPQNNQLFTVTGQWEYDPATPEGAFLVVRQSRDGGRTFNAPEFLPGNLDGVQIPNVTPQNFGLMVYVADADGHSSPGVFRSIFAWNTPQPAPAPTASVAPSSSSSQAVSSASALTAPETPKAKRLTQTGAGAMFGLAAFGAFVGWKRSRKVKRGAL
ncbi:MAG: hypothetical protein PHX87_00285 [Candidatus Peribacteraceae bacterium]|nr:hypothetical protein [Candidatus Peribacteraceae bacterium]MDD5741846.1 hypothetical protein [Candidatus Peribacteraceae bacterium]